MFCFEKYLIYKIRKMNRICFINYFLTYLCFYIYVSWTFGIWKHLVLSCLLCEVFLIFGVFVTYRNYLVSEYKHRFAKYYADFSHCNLDSWMHLVSARLQFDYSRRNVSSWGVTYLSRRYLHKFLKCKISLTKKHGLLMWINGEKLY